ncbi:MULTISPECIES: dihydrodipicolinate synthase family protein [Clostridium]|uniref:2-keto-3-deoxy-galactonate aldolase YagE n=3 Tax=Clostridium TaxID=1485 RepID=D8GNL4_CLOLD|nr:MULTISPECIES: dihydrodipicolinate synthase family protein [Clostridium]ADK15877.1 dihydrodipicolinate synthase [Clostridium ljungdahlii DSM 13528]AGY75050.1 dihydrodipicolinate synthase family protein [Clostridium autoethanogenum DSM 10061]ALU35224.1 Dihydrodipicolinate synthase [Clostridium autoethanogenum DSM 10061]OAA84252.1 putative 2-keto-3-deoxy-galactonate aldolase YagE [Clostridium ljungdahlii DSM 13528]OVY49275.1 putative 2-keto-3-deoxy-galactonate aldolase YagE [Clostridium autoet
MLKGVFTPMITIFDENGQFDNKSNKAMIEKLISDGIYGICILGTTGEFFNLTFEEKKQYIKFALEVINGRVKLIVGTGSTNLKEVIELGKFAEENNADAILVLPPFYFKLDDNHVFEYFSIIAENTNLPMILYNIPQNTKVNLSPDLVLKLANKYENIANGGVKDTTPALANVRNFVEKVKSVHKNFAVFSGIDEYLIPNLIIGGNGIVGTQTNTQAKLMVETYKTFMNKDFDKLLLLQKRINKIMAVREMPGSNNILSTKTAASIALNMDFNTSIRYYDIKLPKETKDRIERIVKQK